MRSLEQSPGQRRQARAVRRRPAEKVGGVGAAVVAVAYAVGLRDPEWLAALGAVSAAAPAVVTGLVAHGGVVGLVRAVVFGRVG